MKKIFTKLFLAFFIFAWFFSFWNISLASNRDDISSSSFRIETKKFTPGGTLASDKKGLEARVNNWLIWVIQLLLIPLWAFAVLVMIIWSWYMILANGNDQMLNKWKSIFKWWIFSVAIALSSYLIVSLVAYIIY